VTSKKRQKIGFVFVYVRRSQPFYFTLSIKNKLRGTSKIRKILQITCKTLELKLAMLVFTVFLNFVTKIEEVKRR